MKAISKFIFAALIFSHLSCSNNAQTTGNNTGIIVTGEKGMLVDNYLLDLEKKGFAGAVLVVDKNGIILEKGYGYANREKKFKFTPNTLACMGSITKAFTAGAKMKLESQHKLSVTDKLSKYVPSCPMDKANITIHQLLTHSSGLPDFIMNDGGDYAKVTKEDFINRAMQVSLIFTPGSKAIYSNMGMSILAYIIEKVSNKPYETFLKDELLSLAGITTIGYNNKDWKEELIAHGYDGDSDWGTLMDRYKKEGGPYWNLLGNGGLYTSIGDIYKWYKAIQGEKILPKEYVQKMYSRQAQEEGYDGQSFFGYGCNLAKTIRNTTAVDNGGSNGIYWARMSNYIDEGVFMYLVTNNSKTYKTDEVMPAITQLYFIGKIMQQPMVIEEDGRPGSLSSPLAKLLYSLLTTKGPAYFTQNYKQEIEKAGLSLDDDMMMLDAGIKLLDEKKADEAMALYEVYTKEFPNIVIAREGLGDAYLLKGNKEMARKYYEECLKMRPNFKSAKEKLEKLGN